MKYVRIGLLVMLFSLALTGAYAVDSPQFRGPNRDGCFPEQGLMQTWPEGGPAVAWTAKELGKGYSSASVAGGKVYVTGMLEDENGYVFILNEADGKLEKKMLFGKETLNKQAPGTRSTPTIDGDRLYVLSGFGVLYCFDLTKGEKAWEVNILDRFKADNNMWNLSESVLIDGNRVICTPCGSDGIMAALDKMTGATLWTTKGVEDKAAYGSPVIFSHNGRRILSTITGGYVIGADAETGALLWSFEQKTSWNIHGVAPVYDKGLLYYVGGDGAGGGALELSADGSSVTSKWTDKNLDCIHHGVVLNNGYLYGTGEKHDYLMCLEMATGKLMWSSKEIGQAVTVGADGMLYTYEGPKTGIVSLVKASPAGYERTGSFKVVEGTTQHWAHPTIANGRLYIRHGDALIAYTIAVK